MPVLTDKPSRTVAAAVTILSSMNALRLRRTNLLKALMLTITVTLATVIVTSAFAEVRNIVSIADTEISQSSPNQNYGRATGLGADGDTGAGSDQYVLIKWDLSSITPGTNVSSTSVKLNITNPSPYTYEAYRLKKAWAETAATWNLYATGKAWEVAGANGTLDRDAKIVGAITPSATGDQTFSLSANLVQGWVDNPSSNHGIILADTANHDGMSFRSREWTTSSQRPRLNVDLGPDTDPVLVGAGDIATPSAQNDEATAKLLDGIPGTVYTLGDNAYPDGAPSEFTNYYGPTWGRHKARTKPSVGDHEYITSGASGYFGYFGAAAGKPSEGYYSYNLGEWHVVVLNSNCTKVGGCGSTSPMVTWLKKDLAANPRKCTLSYFHHPLFSSGGEHGNISSVRPIWDALYAANADVVLNGNDHNYERFAPQTPSGVADSARGIREFVVGTGGGGLYSLGTIKANSQVRNNTTYGVLKLTLHSSSYTWKFVPVAGKSFTDSGTTTCH
jgi:acid phosphatase type 7